MGHDEAVAAPATGQPAVGGRSFVDLHTHSAASFDSRADARRMMAKALEVGLTHLAITDHERIDGAQAAAELAPPGLQLIVGEEVRSAEGDLVGLFLRASVPPGLSAAETASAIREQGGIVGLPHPFDGFRSSGGSGTGGAERKLEALAAMVDYVETHNARAYRDANPLAGAFAERHRLPGVASSDAHSLLEVGIASTVLPGPFSTAEELRALLPLAQPMPGRASYYVRLWTPLAKLANRLGGNGRIRPDSQGRAP
jgi:predicted metal-dependent phosphoesterase TrpH